MFVNIFTTVWADSQLEAITLIFICKSEINDCGYPAPATNSPVTVSVMTIPTVCLFLFSIRLFTLPLSNSFVMQSRFSGRWGSMKFLYLSNSLASLCPVLSGFMLALESWHHELIQDGSGVLAESGNVRQCYGNVWMAMDGKMWQRGHVVSPGPSDRDIIHHNAAPWCNETPARATKTPRQTFRFNSTSP